ncbi:hypothetical protein CKO27_10545 [Thiocystis violacea]|nr:hypothetical protein [Thiocystis violacea]
MTDSHNQDLSAIDEALAALTNEPLPTVPVELPFTVLSEAPIAHPSPLEGDQSGRSASSLTLGALDPSRRPTAATVCEHCPLSLWFASPKEVKCYCRAMYLIVWSSKEPNQLILCDGTTLAETTL